jgi:hypothetical protein
VGIDPRNAASEQNLRLRAELDVADDRHGALVGFTVTGPKRKLDEFSEGVKAEEWMTIRTETQVMLGPI